MKQRVKKRLTGSFAAKAAAFILLAAGTAAGLFCGLICYFLAEDAFFTSSRQYALSRALYGEAMMAKMELYDYIQNRQLEKAAAYFKGTNLDLELSRYNESGDEEILWSSCDSVTDTVSHAHLAAIPMSFSRPKEEDIFGEPFLNIEDTYTCHVYIDLSLPVEDKLKENVEILLFLYETKYAFVLGTVGSIFLCLICFLFLLCGAGHQNGREGIQPGVLERIPFDLLLLIFVFGGAVGWSWYEEFYHQFLMVILGGTLFVLWVTLFCVDFAVRVKLGSVWRQTLIFTVLRGVWRGIRWMIRSLPTVLVTADIFLGVCILELLAGLWLLTPSTKWLPLWFLEKIILFCLILYVARTCKKLLTASRALAEGQEDYRVDTSGMFGDFREHGENLNSLGLGISKAVGEKMKSERLKTELITNVSHDLKTPLTSIINYADLICEEETENGKIKEYAEVLLRQSGRLKKLLEDLIEAAKATTGNLEVSPEPCEAGVLLSQAVGEYQQKMEERDLELIVRQPENPIKIMADGRHLWRVFDNLLNNICKYSQEHSRVYLSVEEEGDRVLIIFRNMSKYPLDIPPQELEERFVRGDKSRHMGGNGLGLSIAKSLVEMQNGRMEILTDGDLFKVMLRFERL